MMTKLHQVHSKESQYNGKAQILISVKCRLTIFQLLFMLCCHYQWTRAEMYANYTFLHFERLILALFIKLDLASTETALQSVTLALHLIHSCAGIYEFVSDILTVELWQRTETTGQPNEKLKAITQPQHVKQYIVSKQCIYVFACQRVWM